MLRIFLMEHCSEVIKAMTLDYAFDRQLMLEREEAGTKGYSKGIKRFLIWNFADASEWQEIQPDR